MVPQHGLGGESFPTARHIAFVLKLIFRVEPPDVPLEVVIGDPLRAVLAENFVASFDSFDAFRGSFFQVGEQVAPKRRL